MKTLPLLTCIASCAGIPSLTGYAKTDGGHRKKPNIIYILADDLGRADDQH